MIQVGIVDGSWQSMTPAGKLAQVNFHILNS